MRRWSCLVFAGVGIVCLLLSLAYPARANYGPHAGWDRLVGPWRESISTFSRGILLATRTEFSRGHPDPLEYFASHSEFLIADALAPPWLDYRGPPGGMWLASGELQGCRAHWQLQEREQEAASTTKSQHSDESNKNAGFCNRL
jgi:hypothetical protein